MMGQKYYAYYLAHLIFALFSSDADFVKCLIDKYYYLCLVMQIGYFDCLISNLRFRLLILLATEFYTITAEKSHLVSLAASPLNLNLHSCTDSFTKHPNLRTFTHEYDAEEHAQIAFALKPVIKKLWVEQVRGYRKITFLDSESAVTPGMKNILFDIPSIWRADIDHGMIIKMWSCLFLNNLHGLIGGPIHISFLVAYIHI